MNGKEIITVEYSLKQKCFHIDELSNVLKYNQQNVLKHNANDYLLLAVFGDEEAAQEFCRKFGPLITATDA